MSAARIDLEVTAAGTTHAGAGRRRRAGISALLALVTLLGACSVPQEPRPEEVPAAETSAGTDLAPTAAASSDGDDLRTPAARPDPSLPGPSRPDPTRSGETGRDPVEVAPERSVVEVVPEVVVPPTDPPPPPPAGREELISRAGSLVVGAAEAAEEGRLGVLVTDRYGREVVAHHPDRPMVPASTMKVVTAAAVLTTLGPDARIATRVATTAPIDPDGVVHGDLVLLGAGDPVLATERYERWVAPARPRTPMESLADQIVATGVRRVEGALLGSVGNFTGPSRPEGWPARYLRDFDARYHAGLTLDAGLDVQLLRPARPDDEEGATDEGSDTERGETVVTRDGSDTSAGRDSAGTGPSPDLGPPQLRLEHATDPAALATRELVLLLRERGVEVVGGPRTVESVPTTLGSLATVRSPTVEELLRFAVRESDNHLMDALFLVVARARTGEGSWEAGDRAVRQVLARHGIEHEAAVFADGSGLSRDDRLTPRLLVELDRAMRSSRHRATWSSLMAVMGESGTLTSRMTSTPAVGRFVGKTGTLRDVTGLTGSVLGPLHQARYHLAVIANGSDAAPWVGRVLADELVLLLSGEVQGCEVLEGGDPAGVLARPPVAVSC